MRLPGAALIVAAVTLATVGCQQIAPAARRDATPRPIGVEQLKADGLAQLEKGRYENALRAFVEALSRLPDDVGLHYLLGVTYSHMDRKDDAILAFRYVVQYGKPGSQEFDGATRWLAGAGIAAERAQAAGISSVVFDRGGYVYHGRVEALIDASREAGLNKNETADNAEKGSQESNGNE